MHMIGSPTKGGARIDKAPGLGIGEACLRPRERPGDQFKSARKASLGALPSVPPRRPARYRYFHPSLMKKWAADLPTPFFARP